MEKSEMVEILETIARESPNQSAKVAAIRALRQLAIEEEEKREPESADFAQLDEWRERKRTKGVPGQTA